jgi:hypothetical protein
MVDQEQNMHLKLNDGYLSPSFNWSVKSMIMHTIVFEHDIWIMFQKPLYHLKN